MNHAVCELAGLYLAGLDGARGRTVPVVPRAEKLANSVLSLPMGPHRTALELSHTIARLREFV